MTISRYWCKIYIEYYIIEVYTIELHNTERWGKVWNRFCTKKREIHWISKAAKGIAGKKVEQKEENIIEIPDIMYDITEDR